MGHVRRDLLLARELAAHGMAVSFLTSSGTAVSDAVQAAGFECARLPPRFGPRELGRSLKILRPEIVVWDRLDTSEGLCRAVKESGAILITLDDAGPGQKLADITINAMVTGGDTLYKGFDYAILPPAPKTPPRDPARPVRRITVSFGGYDHHRLSEKALKALAGLDRRIAVDLVLGAASDAPSAEAVAALGSRLRVHRTPPDFSEMLASSDLAILAGGATLVEALGYGVPCVAIAQYGHQLDTIRRCEARGAAIGLGTARQASPAAILRAVRGLAASAPARAALSRSARSLVDGLGLERVRKLVTIVEKLPWDTDFFGIEIASLYPGRINENLADYALEKCRRASIRCLYYLCDCHDPRSVMLAERHGFHFVDIRMTFQRALDAAPEGPKGAASGGWAIRLARPGDIPQLKSIAAESYVYSRYFFDRRFPDSLCEKFYANWIEKSCRGYADVVLVAARGSRVLGYIACKMVSPATASISLVSVAASASGSGIGKALVGRALEWARSRGAASMEVVTQGRNYGAQRLYQSAGFKTRKLELWYHKWPTPGRSRG